MARRADQSGPSYGEPEVLPGLGLSRRKAPLRLLPFTIGRLSLHEVLHQTTGALPVNLSASCPLPFFATRFLFLHWLLHRDRAIKS